MTKGGERYVLTTPITDYVLPGSFAPDKLSQTDRPVTMIRAYGYREQYARADPYAAPSVITLTGTVKEKTEDQLSLTLREMRQAVRSATAITRNDRIKTELTGATMIAAPASRNSAEASVTLTFFPAYVPDEDSSEYDW